jgi:DnaJ-class molecular chaperone
VRRFGPPRKTATTSAVVAVKADYYDLLGVSRDADEEEIRRAFCERAYACRRDVSDDPADHVRFGELAEAYGVLSDPASRVLYDRYGLREGGDGVLGDDLDDPLYEPLPGRDVHARLELDCVEAEEGARKLVRYDAPSTCPGCDGRGVGDDPILDCDECDGTGVVDDERWLRVHVPRGVHDGDKLRVVGEGGDGEPGAAPGDLLLELDVLAQPRDPRLVRYLALAGMAAAMALLVAYLLLG